MFRGFQFVVAGVAVTVHPFWNIPDARRFLHTLDKENKMAQNPIDPKPASSLRDDLDRGRGRDKNPYPDPSAAPLGTDDEAAGTPISEEQLHMARHHEIRAHGATDISAPAVLHDGQTREFDSDGTLQPPHEPAITTERSRGWVFYAVAAVALIVLLWVLIGR